MCIGGISDKCVGDHSCLVVVASALLQAIIVLAPVASMLVSFISGGQCAGMSQSVLGSCGSRGWDSVSICLGLNLSHSESAI